jgi:uncharacterized protein (TIGR03435 family)
LPKGLCVTLKARVLAAVGIVALAGNVCGMLAQTAASPAFEVASVKPNKSGDNGGQSVQVQPGGRVTLLNFTLSTLIRTAYEIRESQLLGGPSWINTDRFDIVAKADGTLKPGQLDPLIRRLLADRFSVRLHQETRELTELKLVVARSDRRLGPRLQPAAAADVDCMGRGAAVAALPNRDGPPVRPCGVVQIRGHLWARGFSMDTVAKALGTLQANPIVLNQTGLDGLFNLELEWAPDQLPPLQTDAVATSAPPLPVDGASLFTALQEQLGLKLESTKGPVDVLVIDHVEHPSPD